MSDTVSQNAAIAFMLSQDRIAELRAIFEGAPKGNKAKASAPKRERKVAAEKEAPKAKVPFDPSKMFMIPPGSVDAAGFLKMLRSAKNLRECQEAINAYVGFDITQSYAAQEYRAKTQAQKELRAPKAISETVKAVTAGYVAGMPNNEEKFRGDLKAREKLAVEEICLETHAAETSEDEFDQRLHQGLADVGRARLGSIRRELRGHNRAHRPTLIGIPYPAQ